MNDRKKPGWPSENIPAAFPGRFIRNSPSTNISEILDRLKRIGWKPGCPSSAREINAAEHALRVRFPDDYRAFLLATGGKSKSDPWCGLFRLEELVSLNQALPVFQWFGGLIGVGNEGFLVYALDYRNDPLEPPLVSLGLSSSDWADVQVEANSFGEWLESTLLDC